jgi:hypothetical protein
MPSLSRVAVPLICLGVFACNDGEAETTTTNDVNELNGSKLQVFECTTATPVDNAIATMAFSLRHLDEPTKLEIFGKTGKDPPDYAPIEVTPPDHRLASLNENWEVTSGKRTLRVSGDSDGVFLLDLVLYKNSGYTKGYVSINHADGGDNAYAKVSCTVTEKP